MNQSYFSSKHYPYQACSLTMTTRALWLLCILHFDAGIHLEECHNVSFKRKYDKIKIDIWVFSSTSIVTKYTFKPSFIIKNYIKEWIVAHINLINIIFNTMSRITGYIKILPRFCVNHGLDITCTHHLFSHNIKLITNQAFSWM